MPGFLRIGKERGRGAAGSWGWPWTVVSKQLEETKGIAGTTGGGVAGAAIGSAVGGPLGAVVGAGLGAISGAAAGGLLDYEAQESTFRSEYEASRAEPEHRWEDVSPAYRYGWESHDRPEFHDKTYDHIRTELLKGWTGSSDFADFEPYVKHAWQRRADLGRDGSFSPAAKA